MNTQKIFNLIILLAMFLSNPLFGAGRGAAVLPQQPTSSNPTQDPWVLEKETRINNLLAQKNMNEASRYLEEAEKERPELFQHIKISERVINSTDPERGEGILYIAALNTEDKIIKLLVSQGADINIRNAAGETPLFGAIAASGGDFIAEDINFIKLLLDLGADPFMVNENDPEIVTVFTEIPEIRKLLADKKLDIQQRRAHPAAQ